MPGGTRVRWRCWRCWPRGATPRTPPRTGGLPAPPYPPGPRADTALLRTRGLVKVYRADGVVVEALRGVDFELGIGEFVAIMGPSGSGKSTLLHVLGGLEPATRGEIWLRGQLVHGRLGGSAPPARGVCVPVLQPALEHDRGGQRGAARAAGRGDAAAGQETAGGTAGRARHRRQGGRGPRPAVPRGGAARPAGARPGQRAEPAAGR